MPFIATKLERYSSCDNPNQTCPLRHAYSWPSQTVSFRRDRSLSVPTFHATFTNPTSACQAITLRQTVSYPFRPSLVSFFATYRFSLILCDYRFNSLHRDKLRQSDTTNLPHSGLCAYHRPPNSTSQADSEQDYTERHSVPDSPLHSSHVSRPNFINATKQEKQNAKCSIAVQRRSVLPGQAAD